MEKLLGRPSIAGVDKSADIGVARGDHTVERRIDSLEGGHVLEPLDVGARGRDDRLLCFIVADLLIGFLLGDGIRFQQGLVSARGELGQLEVRFRGRQVGAHLVELLVYLRRLDLRQKLSRLHA